MLQWHRGREAGEADMVEGCEPLLGELLRGTWNEVLGKSRCSGQETRDVRYVQQARLTLRVPSPGLTQLHTS